ncbi:MAG: hypothetical protein HYY40_10165 [Bacteroidetes bacterium]|nr:hypothetical protein [Bacteroidota bacterium]
MDTFFEIIKFILPAVIVFLTAYYSIKKFLENDHKVRILEMRKENQNLVVPLRLQAYERAVIFLERISPEALIKRTPRNGLDARALQASLLKTIRAEYEHNISQQIYLSDAAWVMVKNAKEEMLKLINLASGRVRDDATGLDLSRAILEMAAQLDKLPTQIAIDALKREVRQTF